MTTRKPTYTNLTLTNRGSFQYRDGQMDCNASASFSLSLIRMAWENGCDFEDLADGYGPGLGTMGGDWSGIRDSSDDAESKMLQRALNYIEARLQGQPRGVAQACSL